MARSRIRTVKPEVFRHLDLYQLETRMRLPLRFAWVGLFTVADREGRFKWDPIDIKLDVLPHDKLDFSEILEALASEGFIVKYSVGGKTFGHIPSWRSHQVINVKEAKSLIPCPKCTVVHSNSGECIGIPVNARGELEGKGTGREMEMELEGKGRGTGEGKPEIQKDTHVSDQEIQDMQQRLLAMRSRLAPALGWKKARA